MTPQPPTLLWLSQADLEAATSKATVFACFNDDNAGSINDAALIKVLNRAEQQVLSWLVGEYGPGPFSSDRLADLGADTFLQSAALEYAIAYMFDRAPDYVRQSGQDVEKRLKSCKEQMQRILDARQRPPTVKTKPANIGGAVVDNAARIYVDNADGTRNSGDYAICEVEPFAELDRMRRIPRLF